MNTYLPFFVYGTLMEGFHNFKNFLADYKPLVQRAELNDHVLLAQHRDAGFPYMATREAVEKYNEVACGNWDTITVKGQLITPNKKDFDVILKNLDRLEGVPHHYDRKEVIVWLIVGGKRVAVKAWTYYLPDKYVGELFYNPIIDSGSWKEFTNART